MRIADVSAFYTPHGGGVRTYVERKLAFAERAGVELTVIVPGAADRVERRGAHTGLLHLASPRLILDRRYRYFGSVAQVHGALDRIRPDLVEASSPWRTASIVAGWRGAAPRALVMHADPLAAYAYRWLGDLMSRQIIDRGFDWFWAHLRRVARSFGLVVSANQRLAERLIEGGIPRVATVPLGVEAGVFSPDRRDPRLRTAFLAQCGLDGAALLLVGVGRHSPEKRWTTVIDAAAIAGMQRPIGLLLVGDGRERARLERQVGGNPHVRLLPSIRSREQLAALLASADALIHGCEAETFGLAAAEAVASGLPLIVPDEGGATDLADPVRAEVYRAGDTGSAAAAILRLADRDRGELMAAARIAAAQPRTMDEHFADLLDRYGCLLPTTGCVACRSAPPETIKAGIRSAMKPRPTLASARS